MTNDEKIRFAHLWQYYLKILVDKEMDKPRRIIILKSTVTGMQRIVREKRAA